MLLKNENFKYLWGEFSEISIYNRVQFKINCTSNYLKRLNLSEPEGRGQIQF